MKLVWLNKRPTNYDMLKSALPYATSDIPELIRKICKGGGNNVCVLDDEMFTNLVMHASTSQLFHWWVVRRGVLKFDGRSIPRRSAIQIQGYWFIDESLAEALLVGNLPEDFEITSEVILDVSDLEKDYGVEIRTARAREFESYNVFKRIWLAITKQVIF